MHDLAGKRVVVTGGSEGLGRAMVTSLLGSGAQVTAIARDVGKLGNAERVGAATIAGHATDARLMNRIIANGSPDISFSTPAHGCQWRRSMCKHRKVSRGACAPALRLHP